MQEECSRDLIQSLIHADGSQSFRLKSVAEKLQVDFSDLVGVGDSTHHSEVLHRQGVQVQFADTLLKLLHADDVHVSQGVIEVLEGIVEGNFAITEQAVDLLNEGSLSLELLWFNVILGLNLLDFCVKFGLFTLLILLLIIEVQVSLLFRLLLTDIRHAHLINDLTNRLLEEINLDQILFNVNILVAFSNLLLRLGAFDGVLSQVHDLDFRETRAQAPHSFLEVRAAYNLAFVAWFAITELPVDVVFKLRHNLFDLLKDAILTSKQSRGNHPLADVELWRNSLRISNLLSQIISVDIAMGGFISM